MGQSVVFVMLLSVIFTAGAKTYGEASQPSASARSLQGALDTWCQEVFKKLCDDGYSKMCIPANQVVARQGLGRKDQQKLVWRCYDSAAFLAEGDENNVLSCVDDCGVSIPCPGGVDRDNSTHATRHDELSQLIKEGVVRYCSGFQAAANSYCNKRYPGTVARKSKGFGHKEPVKWRCYKPESLLFSVFSECVSNCGTTWSCPGGRLGTATNLDKKHFTDESGILQALTSVPKACPVGLVCLPRDQNPPACLDDNGNVPEEEGGQPVQPRDTKLPVDDSEPTDESETTPGGGDDQPSPKEDGDTDSPDEGDQSGGSEWYKQIPEIRVIGDSLQAMLHAGQQLMVTYSSPQLHVSVGSCHKLTVNFSDYYLSFDTTSKSGSDEVELDDAAGSGELTIGLGSSGRVTVVFQYATNGGGNRYVAYTVGDSGCKTIEAVLLHGLNPGAKLVRNTIGDNSPGESEL
ncbi:putative microneme protein MIC1 [Neospora caninum Liverpool]|uniref:Microneme protein MIC1, putative n=2 Tax=Neospora caninum TaxID=29176 RepID=F0VCC5_NEOCL|nr:putative microneme protein MIC1 [Neospora caninum Liverpool]AAL37729.1 microneme-associated protein [Neospora caninum]CBZ51259.1 putative microneme protein MIC1 [Neospora caninum Liverpool]CEL68574.1 TPA: microneme protein MIC1, putative [Neospora caninum Liverpool]|eukprot:XP_003881292.1 putative microneme protein MIC1 [Neospora caninum Liverpool]